MNFTRFTTHNHSCTLSASLLSSTYPDQPQPVHLSIPHSIHNNKPPPCLRRQLQQIPSHPLLLPLLLARLHIVLPSTLTPPPHNPPPLSHHPLLPQLVSQLLNPKRPLPPPRLGLIPHALQRLDAVRDLNVLHRAHECQLGVQVPQHFLLFGGGGGEGEGGEAEEVVQGLGADGRGGGGGGGAG